MLEDDARADSLAQTVPDRLAERARALRPLAVGLPVRRVRHPAPVAELVTVDHRCRAVLLAELPLGVVRDDGDRTATDGARDLERHAAEAARRAPDEDDVARLDDVGRPAHEHPVGGRGAQQEAAGFFPGEPLRLRHALMALAAGELGEASVVGLIAPDARALSE